MEWAKLIFDIGKWAAETAFAFLSGDDGPEPARLAAILPPTLKADLEHARQREQLAREIREDEAKRRGPPA